MSKSIFDILGPIMIGPSSSHTAGAARLGLLARQIYGKPFCKVTCQLHGSFGKTYRGHGTDFALAAGLLGMAPDDTNLKHSREIAAEQGMEILFETVNLGDFENVHENTVRFVFDTGDKPFTVIGSSIGGGNIRIIQINGYDTDFDATSPVVVINHVDRKGVIAAVAGALANASVNIASMSVSRKNRGKNASMVIQTDTALSKEIVSELQEIEHILSIRAVDPL